MTQQISIYAPNLNKLFETFDEEYQGTVTADSNDYLAALLALGILVAGTTTYDVGEVWQMMLASGTKRTKSFKKWLLEWDVAKAVLATIDNDGKPEEKIVETLKGSVAPETVRTILSWLESLGELQLSGQKYKLSDEEEEEYGTDAYHALEDSVSIREEKFSIYDYIRRLKGFGFPCEAENVFTSGMATGLYLNQNYPGAKVYLVGTQAFRRQRPEGPGRPGDRLRAHGPADGLRGAGPGHQRQLPHL